MLLLILITMLRIWYAGGKVVVGIGQAKLAEDENLKGVILMAWLACDVITSR